jgi:hypothetical protein
MRDYFIWRLSTVHSIASVTRLPVWTLRQPKRFVWKLEQMANKKHADKKASRK